MGQRGARRAERRPRKGFDFVKAGTFQKDAEQQRLKVCFDHTRMIFLQCHTALQQYLKVGKAMSTPWLVQVKILDWSTCAAMLDMAAFYAHGLLQAQKAIAIACLPSKLASTGLSYPGLLWN